jgi:hypothetical protein
VKHVYAQVVFTRNVVMEVMDLKLEQARKITEFLLSTVT